MAYTDLFHVLPDFPPSDKSDMGRVDVVFFGDYSGREGRSADFPDVTFGQFGKRHLTPPSIGPMFGLISRILDRSSPSDVLRVHASQMTISAIMRSMHVFLRGKAMHNLAHDAGSGAELTFMGNSAISSDLRFERPGQAIIAGIRRMLFNPSKARTGGNASSFRIAMLPPPTVMRETPTANAFSFPMGVFLAAVDRACLMWDSHIRFLQNRVWSEPAMALQRLAGSHFVPYRMEARNAV